MKLTIFTPSYNRAHTLPRLYESLSRQTDFRFEWIIVDDGSQDTTDSLIDFFITQKNLFPIRYYKQNHGGKHRAQNLAIDHSQGDWFITCDSNKYLNDDTVSWILKIAETIDGNNNICGIGGYRSDFSGHLIGGEIRFDGAPYLDCTSIERDQYNITGDKSTAFRTEILKRYKSPEFPDEMFVTEGVWLLKMALDGYQIRWTPHVLVYGEYAKDGLTVQGANSLSGHEKNFNGFLCYLNLYIKAYGLNSASFMLHQAVQIAKAKRISLASIAKQLDCSVLSLQKINFQMSITKVANLSFVKKMAYFIIGKKRIELLKRKIDL